MVPIKAIDSALMRGNFSSHAGDYDRYASVQKRVVELLCERMSAFEMEDGPMLDVGTGTGALAAEMLGFDPAKKLVVMDIAHGMTRQAANRLPVVAACDGDARHLPFLGETFAGVVSSSVYQWVECLPTAFAEVSRVLKPGGFFFVALFGEKTLCELRGSHRQAVAENNRSRASHVQSFPTLNEVSAAIGRRGYPAAICKARWRWNIIPMCPISCDSSNRLVPATPLQTVRVVWRLAGSCNQ